MSIFFTITTSWLGTCLGVIGALLLATRIVSVGIAYVVMLPGALIWLVLAAADANWALAAQFLVYTIINLVGIVCWTRAGRATCTFVIDLLNAAAPSSHNWWA